MAKRRLDTLLTERGLFPSRSRAAASVMAGEVRVGSGRRRAQKPGELVDSQEPLSVAERPAFVSRGGIKLANALEACGLDVSGRRALDVGSSTGGFTDCLLQRGAHEVIAVDVAYGALDYRLRTDPRVRLLERTNARALEPDLLRADPSPARRAGGDRRGTGRSGADPLGADRLGAGRRGPGRLSRPQGEELPDLATIDVSFISLVKVLPAVLACLAPDYDVLALVKPQFEVGRGHVGKGGVVRDADDRRVALLRVGEAAVALGAAVRGYYSSGLPGPKGNRESFVWLSARPGARGRRQAAGELEAMTREVEP